MGSLKRFLASLLVGLYLLTSALAHAHAQPLCVALPSGAENASFFDLHRERR
ncbi:MAG: hypothetical protein ABIS17_17305 [Casimicrobiaceae bacterium]